MPITFIPNDPLAAKPAPTLRTQKARQDRTGAVARFTWHDAVPEAPHDPHGPEFLFWQVRQAALSAVAAWEKGAAPLTSWQGGRTLDVWQNEVAQRGAAPELNAYYDRTSLSFFEYGDGTRTTFSGASTDVVAHETGHGILDALRPDLWGSPYLEAAALHEAFGDCLSILTALADPASAKALAAVGLEKRNFVETTAEELSEAVRRLDAAHNAAEPRHALNALRWQLPTTLPASGGPGVLINESHSFAQVFTGCVWSLLQALAAGAKTPAELRKAGVTLVRLLEAGILGASAGPRMFQAVGRAMVLADGDLFGGANRVAISDAFQAHGIGLGSNSVLAPSAALAGAAPAMGGVGRVALARSAVRDLSGRLGVVSGGRLQVRRRRIAGHDVAEALHQRAVSLTDLAPGLKGVVAMAPESVLVGGSGGRAAMLGAFPEAGTTGDEVRSYVAGLVERGRIRLDRREVVRRGGAKVPAWHSHAVETVGGQKTLVRIRFSCGGRG